MKNVNLLVWLTQLGLSVAIPLAGFILLALWAQKQFGWGIWVVIVGAVLGVVFAIDGLRYSLQVMNRLAGADKKEEPPVSFNEHQ